MSHTHTCCNDKEICSIHSYRSLDELTYKIKEKLVQLSSMKIRNLFYGYHPALHIDSEINMLTILKDSLDRVKTSFLHIQKSCLDDETIQKIVEKANKIVGRAACPKKRIDVEVDESGVNKYLMSGPRCVSYDTWNEFSRYICGKVGFQITVEKKICDITFEIARNIVSCNLLYALSVHKEMCDLNYRVARTKDECKIDYKLLLEKNPKCDLEFKSYLSYVHKHNLSFPIINEVYASGLTLAEEDGEAVICTPLNNYKLTKITPQSMEELLNLGFVIEMNKFNIINDYKKL
jgi:hypothetical protein